MTKKTFVLVAALAVAASGCGAAAAAHDGGTPSTTTVPTTTTVPATTSVPVDEAERMFAAIADAATAGDLDRLAELALAGGSSFTASFGATFSTPAELADFWRELDADGVRVADTIAALVSLPTYSTVAVGVDGDPVEIHVSPRVMSEDATPADLDEARAVLGDRVDDWFADGQYLGWRLGVDADGNWRFFVFGD